MKRGFVAIALIIFGLTSFSVAGAISGACSSHGGVNCDAGPDAFGYAQCNDEWTSSVSFYSVDECNSSPTINCAPPIAIGCVEQGSLQAYQNSYAQWQQSCQQAAMRSGNSPNCTDPASEQRIATCQQEIQSWQMQQQAYNTCVRNAEDMLLKVDSQKQQLESEQQNQELQNVANETKLVHDEMVKAQNDLACLKKYSDSHSDPSNPGQCLCDDGYQFATSVFDQSKTICILSHAFSIFYNQNLNEVATSSPAKIQKIKNPFSQKQKSRLDTIWGATSSSATTSLNSTSASALATTSSRPEVNKSGQLPPNDVWWKKILRWFGLMR